jgi:O-methyltransferase
MTVAKGVDFRWIAKKYLPKGVTDLLRVVLPESIYYPSYGKTTLSNKKMDQLLRLLQDCLSRNVEGDLIECGVFRGGSLAEIGRMAQRLAPSKRVFGADTFEGHPFDSPEDVPPDNQLVHRKGLFAGNNFDRVGAMLKENELTNTSLLKGMVGDTLPTLGERKFCFVHLDMDLYVSTKQALEYLEPRLVSGGVMVLDDYGGYETPGVEQAVSEVIPHANIQRSAIDPSEGSQGYWVKP